MVVAILGVLRVDINGKVLAVLLCAEIIIVLIYDFGYLAKPAAGRHLGHPDAVRPLRRRASRGRSSTRADFLGFTGFESSVVFSEESKNPKRTIGLATYLSLGIIGGTYALYVMGDVRGDGPGPDRQGLDRPGRRHDFRPSR